MLPMKSGKSIIKTKQDLFTIIEEFSNYFTFFNADLIDFNCMLVVFYCDGIVFLNYE